MATVTVQQNPDCVVLADIEQAARRIADSVHRTPLHSSQLLNAHTNSELFFKCENLQKSGAFKARGASNAVLGLSGEEAAAGVATHSSGNHGAALALAAARRGIPAHIVMPRSAPSVKREAVLAYGGRIIDCEPTLAAREQTLAEVLAATGAHAVHPYDDERVIAGQGTVGLEILQQLEGVQAVALPVGGGGLLAGVAVAIKQQRPEIEIIGVEPAGADDAFRSFGLGKRQPQLNPQTIADGLRAGLGVRNFALIQRYVDTIVTVSEAAIIESMQLQWSRLKLLVEASGAVPFAGVLEHPERFRGRRAVLVVSGGNVDLSALPW